MHDILLALTIEHGLSYMIEYFRKWDIENNGQMDISGTKRAKIESTLNILQYFFICFAWGYILKELFLFPLNSVPGNLKLCIFWITVDGLMMLLCRIFINFSIYLKKVNDNTNNLFTLFQL